MKEVRITAFFLEVQYQRNGVALELPGFGTGSTLAIAMNRAFRSVLACPQMKYKAPKWIYLSVATEGMTPISFWSLPQAPSAHLRAPGGQTLERPKV